MVALKEIAELVSAPLNEVNASVEVRHARSIDDLNFDADSIGWCSDKNSELLNGLKGNVIVSVELASKIDVTSSELILIIVEHPRRAFATVLKAFFAKKIKYGTIAQSASIDQSVVFNSDEVFIGANVVIEEDCTLGRNVSIGHNTVVKSGTHLGNEVSIGSNCTIGGVGFGYENNEDGAFELIPHVGNVQLDDNVEVGNNVCIDRAVMGSTHLAKNVKVDNLVHIAHGVQIDENSLVIAHAMIAGSVKIGKNVWVAPSSSIRQKLTIEDDSLIGLGSVVVKNVLKGETVAGVPAKAHTEEMKITIVIPCRNEVKYIEECVDAIYASEIPEDFQLSVYVVDGMSDDGTIEKINELSSKYKGLSIVENKQQLTPFAFNLGIYEGGKVDYVQIIGARQIISENYLKDAVATFENDADIWCVGGKVFNEFLNETSEIIANAMSTSFGMGLGNFRTLDASGYVDTVGTPMYPYWVFEKIGFFDETLIRNQDDDFNFRVTNAGGKVYYNNDIYLKYYVRGNLKGLRRQFFQYGYWKVYVNKKHKAVTTMRQLVPPLFVLYLISLPFSIFFGVFFAVIWSTPLTIHMLLNVLFSAKSAKRVGEFAKLFITYLILHLSYGMGYLNGLLQFVILNKNPSQNQKRLSR